jgi:hypothetical protein
MYHVYSLIARYLEENVPPGGAQVGEVWRRRRGFDSHHKNKAEIWPAPFSSVIITQRIPLRAFGESVSRPDPARH